jgi:hypothetical protein
VSAAAGAADIAKLATINKIVDSNTPSRREIAALNFIIFSENSPLKSSLNILEQLFTFLT